ncbi:MAG: phosphatase PAP2 family protein [Planctomycetota bacterium]
MSTQSEDRDRWQGRTLLVLAGVFLAISLFLRLAWYVHEGGESPWDRALIEGLRQPGDPAQAIGPAWFTDVMRDVTAFGSLVALGSISAVTCLYLLLRGHGRDALWLLLAAGGGAALSFGLKRLIARPRPEFVPHLTQVHTASFPSGHAMISAVVYLTLAAMLSRYHERRRDRLFLIGVALLVTLSIGFSRIFLGVHWPSDVAAGLCLGSAWAGLCVLVFPAPKQS